MFSSSKSTLKRFTTKNFEQNRRIRYVPHGGVCVCVCVRVRVRVCACACARVFLELVIYCFCDKAQSFRSSVALLMQLKTYEYYYHDDGHGSLEITLVVSRKITMINTIQENTHSRP